MTKHAYKKADKKHNATRTKTMEQILFLSSFFLIDMRMKIDKDTKYDATRQTKKMKYAKRNKNRKQQNKNQQDEGLCKFFFF